MSTRLMAVVLAGFIAFAAIASAAPAPPADPKPPLKVPVSMKLVPTTYYAMYTDLPPEAAQEAALRMTRMAEEYRERTKGFSGNATQRLPFYLFTDRADYQAAGGPFGTAGLFVHRTTGDNAKWLMALATPGADSTTWHTIQHEGFHQFADATIGDLPIWVNEGLAEYFGESIWTGDGFVTGIIPPERLKTIRERIAGQKFYTLPDMMAMTHREWNAAMSVNLYHQAWAMSHYLVHGENAKLQPAFEQFMRALARRQAPDRAWEQNFGAAAGFDKKWTSWWARLPDDPTGDLYARATLSTLTSFIARAHAQKVPLRDMPEFLRVAKEGGLKLTPENWLPPRLLDDAIERMSRDDTTFSIEPPAAAGQPPRVLAVRPDGTRMMASFPARHAVPVRITIDVRPPTAVAAGRAPGAEKPANGAAKPGEAGGPAAPPSAVAPAAPVAPGIAAGPAAPAAPPVLVAPPKPPSAPIAGTPSALPATPPGPVASLPPATAPPGLIAPPSPPPNADPFDPAAKTHPPAVRPPGPVAGVPRQSLASGLPSGHESAINYLSGPNGVGSADHPMVQFVEAQFERMKEKNQELSMLVGSRLIKTGLMTQISIVDGQCFVIEFTPEQAERMIPKGAGMLRPSGARTKGRRIENPAVTLELPKFAAAAPLDPVKPITGQVRVKGIEAIDTDRFCLRLCFRDEYVNALYMVYEKQPNVTQLDFAFLPLGSKIRGNRPLVAFMDVGRMIMKNDALAEVEILSNTVAVVVEVGEQKPKEDLVIPATPAQPATPVK